MGVVLFYILFFFLILYAVIPNILARLGFGVILKSKSRTEIAFTFDDGPNPLYTPQLLDLLHKYGVKATFFIVGEKAQQYPELLVRMRKEGHSIGMHNYVHVSNLLLSPWTMRKHLDKTASIIENATGKRPLFYRPPWGLVAAYDYFIHRSYRMVIWSIIVGDWRTKGGSERIKRKLLHSFHEGAVIVLHDSGDTWGAEQDAPRYMLQALEEVIQEIQRKGYRCVTMDELFTHNA